MQQSHLILESAHCTVDIETAGILTRGYCSVSHGWLPDQHIADPALGQAAAPNIRVIRRAYRNRFRDMLFSALNR